MRARTINLQGIPVPKVFCGKTLCCASLDKDVLDRLDGDVFCLDYVAISIVESGFLHYETSGRRGILKEGSVLFSPAFHNVRYFSCSSDFASKAIFLAPDYVALLSAGVPSLGEKLSSAYFDSSPAFIMEGDDLHSIMSVYEQIALLSGKKAMFVDEMVFSLARVLLMMVCNHMEDDDTFSNRFMRRDNIFRIFMHNAGKYFRSERKLSFYADIICITPDYLSRVVKDVSGKSVSDHLNEMLYREVCHQLSQTPRTINEIALDLNFSDQSALTKFFKQHSGMSPLSYRKCCLNPS